MTTRSRVDVPAATGGSGVPDERLHVRAPSSGLGGDLVLGGAGVQLFERELHLVDQPAHALGALAEKCPPHLLVLELEQSVARLKIGVHRLDPSGLGLRSGKGQAERLEIGRRR